MGRRRARNPSSRLIRVARYSGRTSRPPLGPVRLSNPRRPLLELFCQEGRWLRPQGHSGRCRVHGGRSTVRRNGDVRLSDGIDDQLCDRDTVVRAHVAGLDGLSPSNLYCLRIRTREVLLSHDRAVTPCPTCGADMEAGWLVFWNPIFGQKIRWQDQEPGFARFRVPPNSRVVIKARRRGKDPRRASSCPSCKTLLIPRDPYYDPE